MSSTKERVLDLLEQKNCQWSSGEEIAGALSVSRAAVWKAIEALRKDGYRIEAAPRRGYRLAEAGDVLSVRSVCLKLNDPGRMIRLHIEKELPSTNLRAKELALSGAPHGTVIIAGRQSAGSGHGGTAFASPEGGLYFSILLRTPELEELIPTERDPVRRLREFAAVSVCGALEEVYGIEPEIRKNSELFWNGQKICGILTESSMDMESGTIDWVVIGAGIRAREIAAGLDVPPSRSELAAALIRRTALAERQDAEMLHCAYCFRSGAGGRSGTRGESNEI